MVSIPALANKLDASPERVEFASTLIEMMAERQREVAMVSNNRTPFFAANFNGVIKRVAPYLILSTVLISSVDAKAGGEYRTLRPIASKESMDWASGDRMLSPE